MASAATILEHLLSRSLWSDGDRRITTAAVNLCRYLAGQYPEAAFTYLSEHPRTWTARVE